MIMATRPSHITVEHHAPHSCKAIVFTCIDWRLHPQVDQFFTQTYGTYDPCTTAGSVQGFHTKGEVSAFFIKQIEISRSLHDISRVALTMHEDCGAYGGSTNFASQQEETAHHTHVLAMTRDMIREKFPLLALDTYIITLSDENGIWMPHVMKV